MLEGKVTIITGSGQGLGAAAAKLFAQHGAKLVVTDLDGSKAEQVAQEIKSQGGEAIAVAGDVTAADFPQRCVEATVQRFGTIDILINNAGFTWDGMIHKITPKQWDAMLAVHCTAPFRLIQAAAPVMRDAAKKELEESDQAKQRCIINVSSTSGTHGNAGQANYSTAKAGVVGLSKTVAREWGAFNIRCNAIAYGFIATRLTASKDDGASISVNGEKVKLGIPGGEAMAAAAAEMLIPLKRIGTPDEAAGAMLMLASPYASFISGQTLEVTGGAYI
ncbi:g2759 [Coccomyxa viridis]|uniref:G2759 protein n=1 Tax=Coccomyxa viridis TaxID=1274662 RepID=A0ABP1FL60_9CHLO